MLNKVIKLSDYHESIESISDHLTVRFWILEILFGKIYDLVGILRFLETISDFAWVTWPEWQMHEAGSKNQLGFGFNLFIYVELA